MKTLTNILAKIDNSLTKGALAYINKVSHTLYPKTHLKDEEEDEEDNEPFLFI
ncbi:hypothetical protein [Aquimarina agarilytica]|uniref:hypothetical protein n=1 Tax=Aquimarina agarilytica TaxID=1087449 RepID=UPI0002F18D65|nr:hypothetical protein [Aquimarina agarilytica]